jgi:RHS repeat-associated protein
MTRPNSVTTNYTYDNLSRLTSVLHQLSGSTIDGASYTLDSAGNRTAKTDQLAAATSNYAYDAIYQLTQVTQANSTTESYSYDAVGNRTASLGVSSYTTNASNELTATSNTSYTYDSNGNTLTKTVGSNTTNYTWDYENRLTSVTLPGTGGTVTFKYDPFGRRIEKSSSATTSVFAYDGDNLIEEANSSGTVVARYAQTQNIDEPLSEFRSNSTNYYQADVLGSITSLTSSSGATTETYTYDSFGKLVGSSGSVTNPFQYTGRESDPETGLYFNRARYYQSDTGKFVSEDPLEFEGGDVNFYRYVLNSPLGTVDPIGEWGFGADVCGSAEIGLLVGAGATGCAGAGVFLDGKHPSVGGLVGGGAFAGGPTFGKSAPSCPNDDNYVFGGFVGGGLGLFATNARNVSDLSGPFKTYSLNIGFGLRVMSLQYSVGKNSSGQTIRVFNYGGPIGFPSGVGYGIDLSQYNTNTKTTSGGGECPCK